MTRVTVVSRTCMGESRVCVGALTRDGVDGIRLLPAEGERGWPVDAPYQVGEVWELEFRRAAVIEPPHTEDVVVIGTGQRIAEQTGLGTYLATRVPVWSGPPSVLFDGALKFTTTGRGHLPAGTETQRSVGFWRPAARLVLAGDRSYRYDAAPPTRYVRYVGSAEMVAVIPAGALVRVSLSRRFATPSADGFWLQVSGWYPERPNASVMTRPSPRTIVAHVPAQPSTSSDPRRSTQPTRSR